MNKLDNLDQFRYGLVDPLEIPGLISRRKKTHLFESIPHPMVDQYLSDGWEVDREYKTKTRMKKLKPSDLAFEDKVWSLFRNLGFHQLNRDRNFKIPYSKDLSLTQQIDVFAVDDETILVVECKASEDGVKKGNFKKEIEAIGGKKEGLLRFLKSEFGDSNHKIKFIFATKDYILSGPDAERLENFGILHFDEESVDYYKELFKHLGLSARFQLHGNLFEGQTIPELDNKVQAIQGKMGGHIYYSFLIEPEKLLKIGYVLHRNKANRKLMPTYQRIIKKSRLKSVQEFVDDGGYFPNTIIINIDTRGKKIQFDQSQLRLKNSISKIGILHIPQLYRSAYIIDGQHRLYGFANSRYKNTNTLPVVAFVNLDRRDQVKLFMQINENQKAVPKNLRNTLNSDLLWDSENLLDQVKALKLQIAQSLAEEKSSPLFGRIIMGENKKTPIQCITIDTIKIGLDRSNFIGVFTKTAIKENGSFYRGNNDDTIEILYPFLEACFTYIKEMIPHEWDKGEWEDGFLTINAGIESLIRIFSNIIDHLMVANTINPKTIKADKLLEESVPYLDAVVSYFESISDDEKIELRKSYGTGLRTKYWRKLQKAIHKEMPEFDPEGMGKYWTDESHSFNDESYRMIRALETHFKEDFRIRLREHYGVNWFKDGVPKSVYEESSSRAALKNYDVKMKEDEVTPWDCLHIIDYRVIAIHGRNWSEIFDKYYTRPGEEQKRGGKQGKTEWMHKLETIRNENVHTYSIKEEEYDLLLELTEWMIDKRVSSDLD